MRAIDPGSPITGRQNIVAAFRGSPPIRLLHLISNVVVDIASADTASGKSYMTVFTAPDVRTPLPAALRGPELISEYEDSFVRTPEGWRFKVRRGRMILRANPAP